MGMTPEERKGWAEAIKAQDEKIKNEIEHNIKTLNEIREEKGLERVDAEEEERRRLCRANYAAQMEMSGYNASGDPIMQKLKQAAKYAPEMITEPPAGFIPLPFSNEEALADIVQELKGIRAELEEIKQRLRSK